MKQIERDRLAQSIAKMLETGDLKQWERVILDQARDHLQSHPSLAPAVLTEIGNIQQRVDLRARLKQEIEAERAGRTLPSCVAPFRAPKS